MAAPPTRPPARPPKPVPKRLGRYLRFSTVGLELGLSVLVGLFIGQWLDGYFGTEPWLLLLFLLFGMVAGFRRIYRLLRELNAEYPDDDPGAR